MPYQNRCITIEDEEWRPCPGHEEYFISSNGRLKNKHNRIITVSISPDGYQFFCFSTTKSGKRNSSNSRINRMVAMAFIPNIEDKPEVNHKNGIKTDNRIENLEWATRLENQRHARNIGLFKNTMMGDRHYNRKLSYEIVFDIKRRIKNGDILSDIARLYNVTPGAIREIKLNKNWKQVPWD